MNRSARRGTRRARRPAGPAIGQAVGDLNVAAPERPQQLVLVVARDTERVTGGDHAHDQPQDAGGVRAAVDEIADEDRTAAVVVGTGGASLVVPADRVAELGQQRLEFCPAAVDVADDIERPGLVPQVVEQPRAGDAHVGDLVLTTQRVDRPEALTLQAFQPAAELVALTADHMGAEVAVGEARVTRDAHLLRDVEDDRHRQHVVLQQYATEPVDDINSAASIARPFQRCGLCCGGFRHGPPASDASVPQYARLMRPALVGPRA